MIVGGGLGPGARTKLTKRVTLKVPLLPVGVPSAANVSQVPPPVTFCGFPELELNVPKPVSVILVPSLAIAVACPPGEKVKGVVAKSMLGMSQRILLLSAARATLIGR